jgi:hypothetical protein
MCNEQQSGSAWKKKLVMNTKREGAKSKSRGRDKNCSLIRTKARGRWQVIFADVVLLRTGRRRHDF